MLCGYRTPESCFCYVIPVPYAVNIFVVYKFRVADSNHFNADPDPPDPGFLLNAEPDHDPTFHFDAEKVL